MGFQFSLQTVLQFRENEEKREEIKLQQLGAQIVRVQDELDQLAVLMRETSLRRAGMLAESSTAFHLQAIQGEIDQARRRQGELELHIDSLEQQKVEQVREYQQKRTARNILDEMHKQQREAFNKEQSVQEQKRLDDIFATRIQRDA
ncbi:MAG TPA: hypothetical protein VGJ21_00095 [Terracidiphilus sp.]|jgi:flagellar export protein FliJ